MEKEIRICKECGKEFIPCHKTSIFCSKSCATKWRNNENIKNGTHNFYKLDRSAMVNERVKNGTHPFLTGNMSEDALKRKASGISRARKLESQEHRHPWQQPKNFINNEYSRSLNTAENRGLTEVILYMSDTEFPNTFKIGWTYNIKIREKDPRCHDLKNLIEIYKGTPELVLKLEHDIKEKFFNENYYTSYCSTEIFPTDLKDSILNFIKNFNN